MSNQISNKPVGSKSVWVSLILTFFFGFLGLFYSTVLGAVVMLILYLIVGFLTAGVGLLLLHPITMIWGAVAVSNHNKKLAGGI